MRKIEILRSEQTQNKKRDEKLKNNKRKLQYTYAESNKEKDV